MPGALVISLGSGFRPCCEEQFGFVRELAEDSAVEIISVDIAELDKKKEETVGDNITVKRVQMNIAVANVAELLKYTEHKLSDYDVIIICDGISFREISHVALALQANVAEITKVEPILFHYISMFNKDPTFNKAPIIECHDALCPTLGELIDRGESHQNPEIQESIVSMQGVLANQKIELKRVFERKWQAVCEIKGERLLDLLYNPSNIVIKKRFVPFLGDKTEDYLKTLRQLLAEETSSRLDSDRIGLKRAPQLKV